ncbi:MAG: hypothetical protein V1771_02175, partial [Chloroflexota bacterium]
MSKVRISQIRKRDGSIVPLDARKIEDAILQSAGGCPTGTCRSRHCIPLFPKEGGLRGGPDMDLSTIKALAFDVFGTVVDWRGTVIRELEQLGKARGFKADWAKFADTWRTEGYLEATAKVRRGELPWMNADQLHRRM